MQPAIPACQRPYSCWKKAIRCAPWSEATTIARRTLAARPEARQTFANKLKALRNFTAILLTAKIDAETIERRRDHVLLPSPKFVDDCQAWREGHDPDAGYLPDRPAGGRVSATLVREMIA